MVRGSQVRFQSTKNTLSIPSTKSYNRLPPNRYVPFLSLFLRSYAPTEKRSEDLAALLRRSRPIWGKEIHLLRPPTTYTSSDGGTRPWRLQTGAVVNGRVTAQVEGNIAVDGSSQGWASAGTRRRAACRRVRPPATIEAGENTNLAMTGDAERT
jgi:hypothetical protein